MYNLPTWMATKWFFMPLTLLIPGKQQVKSENIDVYLQPLIEVIFTSFKIMLKQEEKTKLHMVYSCWSNPTFIPKPSR
jgi:hypothetical protein